MPDALQKIRVELGKDAVILNTKEIRIGGFLGFFSKKRIEVIAATDANTASSGKGKFLQRNESVKPNSTSTIAVMDEPLPFVPDVIANKPQPTENVKVEQTEKTERVDRQDRQFTYDDPIMRELKQMKEMMNKFTIHSQTMSESKNPHLMELEEQLLAQEVEPSYIAQLQTEITEALAGTGEEMNKANVMMQAKKQLLAVLKSAVPKNIASDTKVVHFVGPTGVGKTTTIAKLAAEQVLKYHQKVGFITSDTYRIAAVEQLKTYATILNIPLEVVFSPQDLHKAFQQLQDRDIIFMDTAGRNFRNEMYVSELYALLQNKGKSETFLVLSLTTKYKDMKVITENFMKFNLNKVLFTKMDETDTYGTIINLLREFPLSLSYVTNGQNVPEDISEADENAIIDFVLGAVQHE